MTFEISIDITPTITTEDERQQAVNAVQTDYEKKRLALAEQEQLEIELLRRRPLDRSLSHEQLLAMILAAGMVAQPGPCEPTDIRAGEIGYGFEADRQTVVIQPGRSLWSRLNPQSEASTSYIRPRLVITDQTTGRIEHECSARNGEGVCYISVGINPTEKLAGQTISGRSYVGVLLLKAAGLERIITFPLGEKTNHLSDEDAQSS